MLAKSWNFQIILYLKNFFLIFQRKNSILFCNIFNILYYYHLTQSFLMMISIHHLLIKNFRLADHSFIWNHISHDNSLKHISIPLFLIFFFYSIRSILVLEFHFLIFRWNWINSMLFLIHNDIWGNLVFWISKWKHFIE